MRLIDDNGESFLDNLSGAAICALIYDPDFGDSPLDVVGVTSIIRRSISTLTAIIACSICSSLICLIVLECSICISRGTKSAQIFM